MWVSFSRGITHYNLPFAVFDLVTLEMLDNPWDVADRWKYVHAFATRETNEAQVHFVFDLPAHVDPRSTAMTNRHASRISSAYPARAIGGRRWQAVFSHSEIAHYTHFLLALYWTKHEARVDKTVLRRAQRATCSHPPALVSLTTERLWIDNVANTGELSQFSFPSSNRGNTVFS